MDSNINTNFNFQANVTNSAHQHHTEVASGANIGEIIASLTVCDYLGGLAVMLIFLAITRMMSQARFGRKSKRAKDVEFLERIWKLDSSRINH